MSRNHGLWALLGVVVALGCAKGEPESSAASEGPVAASEPVETLSVFTVNYPLQYFAERIGGDLVAVVFPAPADEDPAYWAPGPEVIAGYQQADLILLNGVGYAKWLERATLPASRWVDTSAGFEDLWIPLEAGPVHSHGPQGEHSHKGYAFTTWLNPQLAIEQAQAVGDALVEALPNHGSEIRASQEALIADLQDLDGRLEAEALRFGEEPLLFSHPVYQYLAARYGLNALSVHWEPDEVPPAEQWQELESILASHASRWMIWESEPAKATVEELRVRGVESVVFAPSASRPSSGDLLTIMDSNVAALQAIGAPK